MQDETNYTPVEFTSNDEITVKEKKPFFTFNTILELILLAGLIVLYFLFFTSKQQKPDQQMAIQHSAPGSAKTVFINIDTLNVRYEFVKLLSADLEATGKKLQSEILNEQSKLEKEAADFQKQVQANSITEDKAKIMYDNLMMRQQALMEKKERFTQQVAEKELKMHQTLLDTVTNFLKRYNRSYGYDYILGYSKAGEILMANDTLDITPHVLKALNEEYSGKK